MPVLKPGTQEYTDYYNAITLPGDSPPAQQQDERHDDDAGGGSARGKADLSGRETAVPSDPFADVKAKGETQKRTVTATTRDKGESSGRVRSMPTRSTGGTTATQETTKRIVNAKASDKGTSPNRVQALDPYHATPTRTSLSATVILNTVLSAYRNSDSTYNLTRAIANDKLRPYTLIQAGFPADMVGAAAVASMKETAGIKPKPATATVRERADASMMPSRPRTAPKTPREQTPATQQDRDPDTVATDMERYRVPGTKDYYVADAMRGGMTDGELRTFGFDADTVAETRDWVKKADAALKELEPYEVAPGEYDLLAAAKWLPRSVLHDAGFDDQVIAAIDRAVDVNDSYATTLMKYRTPDGYDLSAAYEDGVSRQFLSNVGFDEQDVDDACTRVDAEREAAAALKAESERTHVALPGEKSWYHWPTGQTVSDEEYRTLTSNGSNTKAEEYSRSAPEVRRGAIEALSTFFFLPAQGALPERTMAENTRMDYAVGAAQIATWLLPLAPKGSGSAIAAGAGAIFGINTAQHWDDMSTGSKALSIAVSASLLLSGIHGLVQPSVKPVKIPLKDGGDAVVWTGLSVRGKPVIGITRLPPNYKAIAEGWQPTTRLETTVAGTRSALEAMGLPASEIDRVMGTLAETRGFKGQHSPHEPSQVRVEDVAPQALTPDELAIVLKQIHANKQYVEMVFGSTTMKPQLEPSLRNWRKLGDVEIQFASKASAERVKQVAKDMLADLEKQSPGKFSIDETGMLLVSKEHHAVELKLPNDPSGTGLSKPRQRAVGAWGIEFHEAPIIVEYPGIGTLRIMRLGESGARKMASITELTPEGFAPPAHRTKDIIDYYVILRTFKGKTVADKWAKLYGLNPDEAMAAAAKNPPRLESWAFEPQTHTPGLTSPGLAVSLPADMAAHVRQSSPSLYREITSPFPSSPSPAVRQRYSPAAFSPSPSSRSASPSPRSPSPASSRAASPTSPSRSPVSPSSARSPSSTGSRSSPGSPKSPSSPASPASPGSPGSPKSPGSPHSPRVPYAPPARPGDKRPPKKDIGGMPDRKVSDDTGRVQWKQGAYWVMVEPPPTEGERRRNVYYSRRPFWGVRKVTGNPEQTFAKQGNPPRQFLYEMGATSARIHSYERPHLRWRQTAAGRRRRGRLQR